MKERILEIISKALDENVEASSCKKDLPSWDSIGHLSILTALDKATEGKINKIPDFNNVDSVQKIMDLFEKHDIKI